MKFLKDLTTLAWIGLSLVAAQHLFGLLQFRIAMAVSESAYITILMAFSSAMLAGIVAVCSIMLAKKQWVSLLVTLLCAATLFIPVNPL